MQKQQLQQVNPKETTLERADFPLQLLMFVTAEKEREMFIILFISIFCTHNLKLRQAERDHESSDQPA